SDLGFRIADFFESTMTLIYKSLFRSRTRKSLGPGLDSRPKSHDFGYRSLLLTSESSNPYRQDDLPESRPIRPARHESCRTSQTKPCSCSAWLRSAVQLAPR